MNDSAFDSLLYMVNLLVDMIFIDYISPSPVNFVATSWDNIFGFHLFLNHVLASISLIPLILNSIFCGLVNSKRDFIRAAQVLHLTQDERMRERGSGSIGDLSFGFRLRKMNGARG